MSKDRDQEKLYPKRKLVTMILSIIDAVSLTIAFSINVVSPMAGWLTFILAGAALCRLSLGND